MLPAPLAPLGALVAFVGVIVTPNAATGKTDKYHVDVRTGGSASSTDPSTWCSYDNARAWATAHGHHVGFVFHEGCGFWFLDVDEAWDGEQWSPVAQQLCTVLAGCAVEVSTGGRGLHIFGRGTLPDHACRNGTFGIELYHRGRFCTLTGTNATGSAAADASAVLPWLVDSYFPPKVHDDAGWTVGPCPEWYGPVDDADLIRRASRAKSGGSVFGGRACFADLWEVNVEVLRASYPDPMREYDASSADRAMAQHLAFWTGKDCERIERIMRNSKLYREKWDKHKAYLQTTIVGAVGAQVDVCADKRVEIVDAVQTLQLREGDDLTTNTHYMPEVRAVEGAVVVPTHEQAKFFEGCVYVMHNHAALIRGGYLVDQQRFRVMFGGYDFPYGTMGKLSTRNAWECFTESQLLKFPRADTHCFRPELPPGAIVREAGFTAVNTYWPIETEKREGDPSPFLNHVAKMLPDVRDQKILLSYMAAIVQNLGVKFPWAIVLQGVQGNGKSMCSHVLKFCIGDRYTHWPDSSKLGSQFNGWMYGKMLYLVEDVLVGEHQDDVLERLKPMITADDGISVESKGVDQISQRIVGNFVFNMNNKRGLRKSADDRRLCLFYTAQQHAADLTRDGMHGSYFPDLYDWLKKRGGFQIMNHWLSTWPIPEEYNPAGTCKRAPETSTTASAIKNGYGSLELEVIEAIEQCVVGFRGGWVSSVMLDAYVEARKLRASRTTLVKVLENLGYVTHPSLPDGRTKGPVLPDGARTKLYVKPDSFNAAIQVPIDVSRSYAAAQIVVDATVNSD